MSSVVIAKALEEVRKTTPKINFVQQSGHNGGIALTLDNDATILLDEVSPVAVRWISIDPTDNTVLFSGETEHDGETEFLAAEIWAILWEMTAPIRLEDMAHEWSWINDQDYDAIDEDLIDVEQGKYSISILLHRDDKRQPVMLSVLVNEHDEEAEEMFLRDEEYFPVDTPEDVERAVKAVVAAYAD